MAEKLTIELIVDDKGSVVVKDFSAKTEKALGKIDASTKDVDKATQGWMKSWNVLGVAAAAAAGVISYKLLEGLETAKNAARDLNETVNKSNTIFDDQAVVIDMWANNSAAAFGLSKQAALENAATLGNMFKQLGAGTGLAAESSKQMVELSADLASFHNATGGATEVLNAMTSAFRGEYDALQRYIPTINAAAVEQEALAMTGKKSKDELTNLEKALATQAIITRDAGDATGDFARTSDELANKERILAAQLENLSAVIGEKLLDPMTGLVGVMSDAVDIMTIWAGGETALQRQAELAEDLRKAWVALHMAEENLKNEGKELEEVNKKVIERLKELIDKTSLAMGRQAVFYKKVADAAEDTGDAIEEVAKKEAKLIDDIKKLTLSKTEYTIAKLQEEVAAHEKAGLDEYIIREWYDKQVMALEEANAEARRQILERFQDDFEKSTLSNYEYQVRTLDAQYAAYAEHIDDKVLLDQWYASEVRRLQQELGIFGFMGGDWAAAWSSIVATAQSVMGIAKATQAIIEMPSQVVDSITSLLDSIGDFASNLVMSLDNFIDSIFNMIVNLGDVFTELIPKLITLTYETVLSIVQAIPEFIRALVDSIPLILDAFVKDVPRIILEIVESIPAIIESVIDAIPQIIDAFIDAIPDIIEAFIKSIPDIAEALGKAIVDVIEDAIPGIPGIGGDGWDWGDLWPTWTFPFHKGGIIRAHQGLFLRPDDRVVVAQTGEGILSRQDMANIGGETGFNAIRRGGSALSGGAQINLTINADVITTDDVDAWIAARIENLKEYRIGHQIAQVDITTVGVDEKWPSS